MIRHVLSLIHRRLMARKPVIAALVLAVSTALALLLWLTGPRLAPRPPETAAPTVRTVTAAPAMVQMAVHAQGTVMPRTQADLVPEVSGTVRWVSSNLVPGGYFESGDPLLRIDERDYRDAVERAGAAVSRAEADEEHARFEINRLRELEARGLASPAEVEAGVRAARVAEAHLADARVALKQAERDLSRTELQAPFTGLVESEQVDAGQFVSRGTAIARLYAADYVEVRLPIADRQLAYLDLPPLQRGELEESTAPAVVLSAHFAGRDYEWRGRLARTEAVIDSSSRLVYAVARVDARGPVSGNAATPPPVGLFVQAEIQGRSANDIVVLPRSAIRGPNQVLVVEEGRLRFRAVGIRRIYGDHVYVDSGLSDGEAVCVSPLQAAVDGMPVKTLSEGRTDTLETAGP